MLDLSRALYLFNPLSNESRSPRAWQYARSLCNYLPEKPNNILEISDLPEFIKSKEPSIVVACGGDGTINRVCNAVYDLRSNIPVAVLPLGFGNALACCLGVETIEKSLSVLENQPQLIKADLFGTNIPQFRIAAFTVGIGFDARIVDARMKDRYIGVRSYILSAIKTAFSHPLSKITITVDNSVTLESIASSLVVTNVPIIGQNYMINEHARLNDNNLDCVIFSTKYAYLTNLRFRGFKHPLYNEQNKTRFQARKISVTGETYVQVDGDPVRHTKNVEVNVISGAITYLANYRNQIVTAVPPFI